MRLLCTLLLVFAALSGGMAAPLPKDPLLDRPVTLEAQKRAAGPLLADLSAQTGVKLSVNKALGAWTFTLRVQQCPLRDVMAGMEVTGAFGWVPQGPGAYHLTIPGITPPPMEMARFMSALQRACPEWMLAKPKEKPADPRRGEGPTLGDRVYAALPEAMRRRLEMGEEIPFPELPEEVRRAVLESRQSEAQGQARWAMDTQWNPAKPGLSVQAVNDRYDGQSLWLVAPAEKGPDGKPLPPSPEQSRDAPAGWQTLHRPSFAVASPSDGVPAPPNRPLAEVALPVARDGGLNVLFSAMHPYGILDPEPGTPVEKLHTMIPERLRDWYRWEKAGSVWAFTDAGSNVPPGTPELDRARRALQSALPREYARLLSAPERRRWQLSFELWSRLWDSLTEEQRKAAKPFPVASLSAQQRQWIEAAVQVDLVDRLYYALRRTLGYDLGQCRLSLSFGGMHEQYTGMGCPRTLSLRQGGQEALYGLDAPSQPPILPMLPGYDAALNKRIDLAAKDEPAAAVAERLGRALGVKMSAPADAPVRLTGEFHGARARLVLNWVELQTGMQWAKQGAAYALRPTWNLEGRVTDAGGKAVEGARITVQSGLDRRRAAGITDAEGHFRLVGLSPGAASVFAEKEGFRFHGQVLPNGAAQVAVKLAPAGEPAEPLRSLPGALPAQEESAIALRLADPILERISREGLKPMESRMHGALMRLAPERMQAGSAKSNKGEMSETMRSRLAAQLLKTSPDEALALIESIKEPYPRAYGYIQASDALPAAEAARKADLLAQALVSARSAKEPQYRVVLFANVGEHLFLLGKKEMAAAVLREGETLARALPTSDWAGFARGWLAQSLSLIDLPAALELIKGIADKRDYDRHHGNIAHKLAGLRPADAERVFGMLRDDWDRSQFGPRVCYRMAPVDLPRAQKIAESIPNPYERAFARGVMAHALAAKDRPTAEKLLREAFESLARLAQSRNDPESHGGLYSGPAIAGALLPAAEVIDPSLVPEFLWRAIACRQERTGRDLYQEGNPDASLAMMLARYDLDAARAVLESALARGKPADSMAWASQRGDEATYAAAAAVDPARAVGLVEALPEDPKTAKDYERKKDRARGIVAGVLSLRGPERWEMLQREYLHLWVIDTED